MANTVTYVAYQRVNSPTENLALRYVVTFTGSYVNGTGESINFLTAANPNGLELNGFVPATVLEGIPEYANNIGAYGAFVSSYANGIAVVKFYSASGTELASGAYVAPLLGGQLTFTLRYKV